MKTLITGGAGFIGSHLAKRLLDEGHEIHLVDNFSRGRRDQDLETLLSDPRVHVSELDLVREDSIASLAVDFDYIFHLAAIIGVANVLQRPYEVLRDNVIMLTNLIELGTRQKQLKRFIFASTSEVYAGTLQHFTLPLPTPETTPLATTALDHPRTSYMLSKIYGEALCQQSPLPFTIVRPHNFYGPRMGMSHVIPELLRKAYATADGGSLEVFSVTHQRTFCYIDDAIEFIVRASAAGSCVRQTLNVGAESPLLTIGEVAGIVLDVVGRDLEIAPMPDTPGSPTRRCPDMRHAEALTGYVAKISPREGIERTFDWYREHIFEQ
jgi:UDP-glucose 4-epimerase